MIDDDRMNSAEWVFLNRCELCASVIEYVCVCVKSKVSLLWWIDAWILYMKLISYDFLH